MTQRIQSFGPGGNYMSDQLNAKVCFTLLRVRADQLRA